MSDKIDKKEILKLKNVYHTYKQDSQKVKVLNNVIKCKRYKWITSRYGQPGIANQPSRIARRLSWRIFLYHVQTFCMCCLFLKWGKVSSPMGNEKESHHSMHLSNPCLELNPVFLVFSTRQDKKRYW